MLEHLYCSNIFPTHFASLFATFFPIFSTVLGMCFYDMKPNTKGLWKHAENKCTVAKNCSTENDSEMLFSKIQENILLANTCQDFQNLYT